MKNQNSNLVFGKLILMIGIIFCSCTNDQNGSNHNQRSFQKLPPFIVSLYGRAIQVRTDRNVCECHNDACQAYMTCTVPADCTCTCTDSLFGSSCSCSGCNNPMSYDLSFEQEQYDFWHGFSDILENDGSANAILAQDEILNIFDAVASDNFSAFADSKSSLKSYCLLLSGITKSSINYYISLHGFVDTL